MHAEVIKLKEAANHLATVGHTGKRGKRTAVGVYHTTPVAVQLLFREHLTQFDKATITIPSRPYSSRDSNFPSSNSNYLHCLFLWIDSPVFPHFDPLAQSQFDKAIMPPSRGIRQRQYMLIALPFWPLGSV